jgi:hypothetical protein
MIGVDVSIGAVAMRKRARGVSDWPENAVAVWLIFGQSNAEGYAPWSQDPAHADPANAVDALTAAERQEHDWVRFSIRGAGASAERFEGQGLATDLSPRTSGKVWTTGANGIPSGTESFGPEVGLIRHVLDGGAPANWRNDAAPQLYVLKQVEGGKTVDHFRWGGAGASLITTALRQISGETLTTLAATKTVLIQGAIFVIGEADSTSVIPGTSTSMAGTLDQRFGEWIRQIREMLGFDAPVALVEIYDEVDTRKQQANAKLAALAAATPNATLIQRTPEWTHIGDNVHYDAAGQDRIGAATFGRLRETYGRSGDGLVMGYAFERLKPCFLVPPMFTDDGGAKMRLAATASETGTIHALVLAEGSAAPTAAQIVANDAGVPGYFAGFSRPVTRDVEEHWFSPDGSFAANVAQDVHFVLQAANGDLGPVRMTPRNGNVKFAPDLTLRTNAAGAAMLDVKPTFAGDIAWSLFDGTRHFIRPEDVEASAFAPLQVGSASVAANAVLQINLSGLTPGADYTLIATGRKSVTGQVSVTQSVSWTSA